MILELLKLYYLAFALLIWFLLQDLYADGLRARWWRCGPWSVLVKQQAFIFAAGALWPVTLAWVALWPQRRGWWVR